MNNTSVDSQSRPFSLLLYLLIVFGLSWPFQIISAIWGNSLLAAFALNGASMVMVTIGTYIAGKYVFRDGFSGAGWQWGKAKHYLAVSGIIALLWIIPTLVRAAVGSLEPSDVDTTQKIIWVPVLLFVTLIPGFGEEFGWRGYMLPRLAERMSPRKAVLLHSVIWWAWHIPVVAGGGFAVGAASAEQTQLPVWLAGAVTAVTIVAITLIPSVLHAVIFAYLWVRSRSLAVVTVYHAAYDGFRDSLGVLFTAAPMVGLWANAVIILLGAGLLWRGDWSSLERGAASPKSEENAGV